jgi:hypothetical protein
VGTDAKLIMLFAVLHLVGMALAGVLLVMFMRSDAMSEWPRRDDDGGGGGGNDRVPPGAPPGPSGGRLLLDDARPARVRLREPGRLADRLPPPGRRPAHAPGSPPAPRRVPARGLRRRPG